MMLIDTICTVSWHLSKFDVYAASKHKQLTTAAATAVEVCLKNTSNANPADIKALVER